MNQLMIKKKNELTTDKKKGFTLIELIIVIAIIAILAAVAIPKFGAVKENANLAADQANAKIIATAVAMAVSNGDITSTTTQPATGLASSTYSKYIDGGDVPKPKSKGATNFNVTYAPDTSGTSGNGTIITITGGTGFTAKQVYPPLE